MAIWRVFMDWRTFVLFLHGRSFIPCPCVEGNWCKQLCIATGFSFKVSTLTNQEYSRVRHQGLFSTDKRGDYYVKRVDVFSYFDSQPEHGVIIDRFQVLPVTPPAIHLSSLRFSLIGKTQYLTPYASKCGKMHQARNSAPLLRTKCVCDLKK